jgi:RHS repeat-associated protein
MIAGGTAAPGTVIDGSAYATNGSNPFAYSGLLTPTSASGPKAFLNYLFFDRNFVFDLSKSGFVPVTEAAKENGTDVAHEKISAQLNITESGYVYAYLSNDNTTPVEVYFDDFKVTHEQSAIVAGADYYPFGLAMENREITDEPYRYGYQGQFSEKNDSTGWNEFQLRFYDAKIARWLNADPYGQYYSPYMAMGNTPHMSVDPTGGWSPVLTGTLIGAAVGTGIGLIVDPDHWYYYTAGGAGLGALGGAIYNASTYDLTGIGRVGRNPGRVTSSPGSLSASGGKGSSVLNSVSGIYFRIEAFDPGEITFKSDHGTGNAGTFDNEEIEPDEAMNLYLGLNGHLSKIIGLKSDRWFTTPVFEVDFGQNSVSGTLHNTNFSISARITKNGIRIHSRITNTTAGWGLLRRSAITQAVRVQASLNPNFNPKGDPIIGALKGSQTSVNQVTLIKNGAWGPTIRGKWNVSK